MTEDEKQELPQDAVVLEIATKDKTFYRVISLVRLREIAKKTLELKEKNKLVWEATQPFAIDCDDQVEYSLVLDGEEDEESWAELQTQLEGKD